MRGSINNNLRRAFESQDLNAVKRLYKNNPKNINCKFVYAKMLVSMENGNMAYGITMLKELLKTENWAIATLELGRIESKKGNYSEALKYFNTLLKCHNKDLAIFEIARIELATGNYKRAKELFEQSLSIEKCKSHTTLELGRLECRFKNNKKARDYFESCMDDKYCLYCLILLDFREYNLKKLLEHINYGLKNNIITYMNDKVLLAILADYNIIIPSVEYPSFLNYGNKQYLSFKKEVSLDHIFKRHAKDFFINEMEACDILYDRIQSMLCDKYRYIKLAFNDYYILPNVLTNDLENKYIKVICQPGTYNILTMYPVKDNEIITDEEIEVDYDLVNDNQAIEKVLKKD